MEIPKFNTKETPTKTIPLEVDGEMCEIKIRKLTLGERNQIEQNSTKVTVIGKTPQTTINFEEVQAMTLSKCIQEAPFPTDLDSMKNLPEDVGAYLYSAYMDFAGLDDKKKDE
jgi:hypothetical protein